MAAKQGWFFFFFFFFLFWKLDMLGCLIELRKLNNIKIMQTHISCVGVLPIIKVVHGRHSQCFLRLSFVKPKLINKKISSWISKSLYQSQFSKFLCLPLPLLHWFFQIKLYMSRFDNPHLFGITVSVSNNVIEIFINSFSIYRQGLNYEISNML